MRLTKKELIERIIRFESADSKDNDKIELNPENKNALSSERTIVNVNFTDLLYAVVMGATLQNFSPFDKELTQISWKWEETILLASLLIIVDDWVLYHAQASKIKDTSTNFAMLLLFDVAVLVVWYVMSKTWMMDSKGFKWFLMLAAIFYLISTIWEISFFKETGTKMMIWTHVVDFVVLSTFAIIFFSIEVANLSQWYVLMVILFLLLNHWTAWRKLVFHK
jgi:hypothetical protein